MNMYDARWNSAKKYMTFLRDTIKANEHYHLFFDGMRFNGSIIIDEENRTIELKEDNVSYILYDGDVECDEGAHTLVEEWLEDIQTRVQVFQEISILWKV